MEGTYRSWGKIFFVYILCSAVAFGLFPFHALAAPGLDLAHDNVNFLAPGISNVRHEISFTLPVASQQIIPTDWILIKFPNYANIHVDGVFLDGGIGTPTTIALVGNTVQMSGIGLLPGSDLTIEGVTANNPQSYQANDVNVTIATDQAGVNIKNTVDILPTNGGTFANASAVINSPRAAISVSGYTSPTAFVTMTDGGSVLATTQSDGQGGFTFNLNGLSPGPHTYRFSSTDTSGLDSSETVINLFLLANNLTTASNILLSSTIQITTPTILPGGVVSVNGTAKPNSQINIFLEAPLRSYTATSDVNGLWSYSVPGTETSSFTPGQYQIYTIVQDLVGDQSIVSPTVNFTVTTPPSDNPPPNCDISHGDLNCDHKTNLTDFSILLFHWQTNHKVADINSDGKVNLTDFSIMMFYFVR